MKKERLDGKLYETIDERPIKGRFFDGSRFYDEEDYSPMLYEEEQFAENKIDFVNKVTSIWDDFGYIWEIWQIHTIEGITWTRAFNTGETIADEEEEDDE